MWCTLAAVIWLLILGLTCFCWRELVERLYSAPLCTCLKIRCGSKWSKSWNIFWASLDDTVIMAVKSTDGVFISCHGDPGLRTLWVWWCPYSDPNWDWETTRGPNPTRWQSAQHRGPEQQHMQNNWLCPAMLTISESGGHALLEKLNNEQHEVATVTEINHWSQKQSPHPLNVQCEMWTFQFMVILTTELCSRRT